MADLFFDWFQSDPQPPRTTRHFLSGTTTLAGLPVERLVVVLERTYFTVIATTLSNPTTGLWELSGLEEYPENELIVMAIDNTGTHNSLLYDYVSQGTTVP